jgi:putative transposase
VRLLVRPETVLRWHRDLLARRHARVSGPKRVGRPPTVRSVRVLMLRLARENGSWGYRCIHGELLALGITVAASTVWEILKQAGVDPAPGRTSDCWATFLRSQAEAILASLADASAASVTKAVSADPVTSADVIKKNRLRRRRERARIVRHRG